MAGVFSERVLLVSGGSAATYTVPGGKVLSVKALTAANLGATTNQVLLYVNDLLIYLSNIASNQAVAFGGTMIVVRAGETLKVVTGPGVNAQVSGFLLDQV